MAETAYPVVTSEDDLISFAQEIARLRDQEDIPDFNGLKDKFPSGRSTGRIPSSNSDVVATDNVGDIVNDATFEYKLLETSTGVLQWDRRALDVAW